MGELKIDGNIIKGVTGLKNALKRHFEQNYNQESSADIDFSYFPVKINHEQM